MDTKEKSEREFGFVLRMVGQEIGRWMLRKEANPHIVAECVSISKRRFDMILKGLATDVTLKEISDIAFYLGLELKASVTKG